MRLQQFASINNRSDLTKTSKLKFILVIAAAAVLLGWWNTSLKQKSHRQSARVAGANIDRIPQDLATDIIKIPPQMIDKSKAPNAHAKAQFVIDVNSAYVMYEKNADERLPIASITKVMTAIVALENYALDEVVTVQPKAAGMIGSNIGLVSGEKLTVENLLKGLLIQSGNDTAYALAQNMGEEKFIAAMNEKARYLGLVNTKFVDPAGLDDNGYSTAREIGIMSSYALRLKVLRQIAKISQTKIRSIDGNITHTLSTSNRLIKTDHPLFFKGAEGLKTGFTPKAGHCLVASASRNGNTVVSVILHTDESNVEASAKESRKLLTWAFKNWRWD